MSYIESKVKEAREALDLIDNGRMNLHQISRAGIMRKEYWMLLAGAVYPRGTYAQRADRAERNSTAKALGWGDPHE
jgi:hypothetical protein